MKPQIEWNEGSYREYFFKSIFLSFKLVISGKMDHLNTCNSAVTWKIMPSPWNDNPNPSELRLRRLCGIDIVLLFYCPEVSCFFCLSLNATRQLLLLHNLSSQTYQKKNKGKTKNKNKKIKRQKPNQQKEIGEMKKQFLDLHLTQVIL